MSKEEFVKILKEELNITCNTDILSKLEIYANFLLDYNKITNLTAITDIESIYLKHFYDSLTITKEINLTNEKILDIGTGAGFPGVVLKIFYPEIKLFLLDSNNKKTIFLTKLIQKLNIDAEIINDRAEQYINNKREYFNLVVSRAVASLPLLVELSLPYVKVGGYFIAMKGNAQEEINLSLKGISILGGTIENINQFSLINNNGERTLIKIKKTSSTNNKYPRNYNQILKKPL